MLLISVGNSHIFTPIIVKTLMIMLLEGLVLIPLLETVGSRPIVRDIDGMWSVYGTKYEEGSSFLLCIISREERHDIATRRCFARLMTELNAFTNQMWNGLPGKTFMIPRAAVHRQSCPNDV